MRIALLTDGIWPYVLGGMQKHSYYLCKYFAQSSIHVDLYHFNSSTYDISQLDVFTDEERPFIHSFIIPFPVSIRFPGHYLFNSYRYSRALYQAMKPRLVDYDFIYTKGFTGWHLLEQKKKSLFDKPLIGVKFHGYEMFQKPPDLKTRLQHFLFLRRPVRAISRNADVVFSYGGNITGIISALGVPVSRIFEIPSGVEASTLVEEVRPAGEVLRFVFLGRYERRKGIEELNRAIKLLLATQPNLKVQFNFIGPIPGNRQIKNKNVRYFGEIRNKQKLQELIRQQDILLCPSWSEGMPNVILEAMAAGLAVVATDVGATAVLIRPETGWLLKDSAPELLASTLSKIQDLSPEEIQSRKQASLKMIREEFTWEKLIQGLINGIKEKTDRAVVGPIL
jgi:glycosyltransferase involved in cell wall biosynthesis